MGRLGEGCGWGEDGTSPAWLDGEQVATIG